MYVSEMQLYRTIDKKKWKCSQRKSDSYILFLIVQWICGKNFRATRLVLVEIFEHQIWVFDKKFFKRNCAEYALKAHV